MLPPEALALSTVYQPIEFILIVRSQVLSYFAVITVTCKPFPEVLLRLTTRSNSGSFQPAPAEVVLT